MGLFVVKMGFDSKDNMKGCELKRQGWFVETFIYWFSLSCQVYRVKFAMLVK